MKRKDSGTEKFSQERSSLFPFAGDTPIRSSREREKEIRKRSPKSSLCSTIFPYCYFSFKLRETLMIEQRVVHSDFLPLDQTFIDN